MKKKNNGKYKQFLHIIMIQSNFQYLLQPLIIQYRHLFTKMAKIYPFRGRGFHTPVELKIGHKVINKQLIIQILIVNTTFNIYGNIRLKEISILNSFEQIQENIISGSPFSARLGSSAGAFIPDRYYVNGKYYLLLPVELYGGIFLPRDSQIAIAII